VFGPSTQDLPRRSGPPSCRVGGSHREVIPERDWKDINRQHIRVTQGGRGIEQMQTDYALGLHLLVTLSALFLLIACANIANLLLARGSANIPDKLGGLYQRLEDALPQIPGVLSASRSWYSPLGGNNANERVYIQGKPPDYRWTAPSWDRVGPHYFETIGTRLLRGRVIDEHDTPAARHVAVINETFARRFFPTEDPIGQHFGMEDISHSGDYDIVAIVGDAKYQDTRGPAYATFCLPLLQTSPGEPVRGWVGGIELRVADKPENIESAVRRTLADVDPNLTVLNIVTFGEQVARNFNQERLIARLAELFGVLALILACVGLYGVTAYARRAANQRDWHPNRTRCRPQECPRPSAGSALLQLGIGLAIDIPVALVGGRILAGELYGVKNYDAMILGLVAATILVASALIAASVPARRAASVDPLVALRYE